MRKNAQAFGLIGIPTQKDLQKLEWALGKRVRYVPKKQGNYLLVGRGIFPWKRKIILQNRDEGEN